MVALDIVDDIGAVLVIVLLYTSSRAYEALLVAAVGFAVLVTFNRLGVRRAWPYFIVGIVMWLAMLTSGIHATIAGILVAATIPAKPKKQPTQNSDRMRRLLDRFDASHQPGIAILANAEQG